MKYILCFVALFVVCLAKPPQVRLTEADEATPHSHPYAVAITDLEGNIKCGGSLISANYVLTSTQCLEGDLRLLLGAHNITQNEDTAVEIIIKNEDLQSASEDDVALIKLPSPVALNENIAVIALTSAEPNTDFSGQMAMLLGWGEQGQETTAANVLMESQSRIMTTTICKYMNPRMTEDQMCTSGSWYNACAGDWGGPLVLNDVQIGVLSSGSPLACDIGSPTISARITNHREFIVANSDVTF